MPSHIEITAIYRNQKQRWDDTVLIECELPSTNNNNSDDPFGSFGVVITIKTEASPGELKPNVEYRFLGSYYNHPKYGKQFLAKSFTRSAPHGREGIVRYLLEAPWIGPGNAKKLWDKYGSEAVRMLREQPEEVSRAIGLKLERAEEAARHLAKEQKIEDCKISLADLLLSRGFPKGTIRLAVKEWGNAAADVIRKNPYRLMIFRGCGFARTDKLYLELKLNPAAIKRQALCAWHGLSSDQEGHTWQSENSFVQKLRERISGADCNPQLAFKFGKRAPLGQPLLAGRRDENNRVWFAEGQRARNEGTVAEKVAGMLFLSMVQQLIKASKSTPSTTLLWPDVSDIDASDHQKEQLALSTSAHVGLFTGTPGTGKTRTAALLVAKIVEKFGSKLVAVCAPTGKAAVRITEAMFEYGVSAATPLKARTIHSLLGVASRSDGDGWGFEHNEGKPLPFQFIIVDESSMIDISLMAALLKACALGTHILFIGDPNQLPPVGHGAPLRDFIAAGVPCGELTEIWRNEGSIVKACQAIRFGRQFEVDRQLDPASGKNLKLLEANNGEAAARRILEAVQNIRDRKLADPVWEVQVIVAVNEKSPLSRKNLNQILQNELNPHGVGAEGSPFRTGDKIICLKNGVMPLLEEEPASNSTPGKFLSGSKSLSLAVTNQSGWDFGGDEDCGQEDDRDNSNEKPSVFIANGEIGCVLKVESKRTIAQFSNPKRVVVIPRGNSGGSAKSEQDSQGNDSSDSDNKDSGCNFDLAYAVTCHKMQGSECPIIIIALDEYPGARRICSREWIYTGLSRAKVACFLVGKLHIAYAMCREESLSKRKTFLKERIIEEGDSLMKQWTARRAAEGNDQQLEIEEDREGSLIGCNCEVVSMISSSPLQLAGPQLSIIDVEVST